MTESDYTIVTVPKENVSDDQVVLVEWLVDSGARVGKGDMIALLETSKGTFEVEAQAEGYLFYRYKEGEHVPVGETLAVIANERSFPLETILSKHADIECVDTGTEAGKTLRFSKGALKLIEKHQLDKSIFSSAAMVIKKDVERFLKNRDESGAPISNQVECFENAQKVLIIGGSSHAKTCIDILRHMKTFAIVGIIAGRDQSVGDEVFGVPVIGHDDDLRRYFEEGCRFCINAIGSAGNHSLRWEVYTRLKRQGFFLPNIIHPSATIEPTATIGESNQIMANSLVDSNSKLGNNCIVNAGAVISHDCTLHDNVHIAPGAILAGNVVVERNTLIGVNVAVYMGVRIGSNVIVPNGRVVNSDIPPNTTRF